MLRFDVFKPSRTRLSARLTAQATPSSTGTPALQLEVAGEIGHAGAAEHDRFGAVMRERSFDLLFDEAPRVGAWLFEREHRNFGGADAGAARAEPVFREVVLDRNNRARERRHDAEFRRDQARHVERGFADANDWRRRRASRRLEPGIVETGDDEGVRVARLADLLDQARNGERLVEIALDAGRPDSRD